MLFTIFTMLYIRTPKRFSKLPSLISMLLYPDLKTTVKAT